MITNAQSIDTIMSGGSTDDDTITLTGWDSPLSTSLSTDYSYTATLGTPTSITSGGGGVGATLSTTLNNGLLWNGTVTSASPTTYTNQTTAWATYNNQPSILKVAGDAVFDGEVTIRGVKLDERLTAIEERLGILRPNNDLEGKWEKLKALGEEYRKLEQEILEGENIWDILKK
jgi:hypothetical protein